MSDELKPVNCGCGGEAKVYDNEVRHEFGISHFVVECQKCGIITKWKNTEAEAVESWNLAMGGNKKGQRPQRMLEYLAAPLTE